MRSTKRSVALLMAGLVAVVVWLLKGGGSLLSEIRSEAHVQFPHSIMASMLQRMSVVNWDDDDECDDDRKIGCARRARDRRRLAGRDIVREIETHRQETRLIR